MSKKALHTGLKSDKYQNNPNVIHCPLIEIVPKNLTSFDILNALAHLPEITHILFTSKSSVEIFINLLEQLNILIKDKCLIAVGQATARSLEKRNLHVSIIAEDESSDGIVSTLSNEDLSSSYLLWPHSALSQRVIPSFLETKNIKFEECILYDTKSRKPDPIPNLEEFEEIIFTSPSTINAFVEIFGKLPKDKTLTCIGPVTERRLQALRK